MKKPNHLANHTERLKGVFCIPEELTARFEAQKKLTHNFCAAMHDTLDAQILSQCVVIGFNQGVLVVASSNLTLVNHLRYQEKHLKSVLCQHKPFSSLHTLQIIHQNN